jgi:aspartate/methionine/tyrosine aminotransferase
MANMPELNAAITSLSAPPIPTVQSWGKAYDGNMGPLIDLSQAVPGYPPHDALLAKLGKAAASKEYAGYGPIEGEDALRRAYAAESSKVCSATILPDNIHITSGCNQAFVCAAMAVAGHGMNVLMSNPGYFNHETTLAMLGIGVERFNCEAADGFVPTIAAIEAAITPLTRAVALVSPNNPTGAVYPPALLANILQLCAEKGIWLILDETYRDFLEPGLQHQLFSEPQWQNNLIGLYSFSKSFCIPGHRLGAITATPAVVTQIAKIMDNLQICPPRAAQAAVAEAIPALRDWREGNRLEISKRAQTLTETLSQLPRWSMAACGAYFAFIKHPFVGLTAAEAARRVALEAGVLAIPGSYFGERNEDYLRFAFANADSATIALLPARLKGFG